MTAMEAPTFRLDFDVPADVNIEEPIPDGKSVFDGERVPNQTLERIRAELDGDTRWNAVVAEIRPIGDPRQHLIVWIRLGDNSPVAYGRAQLDIRRIVEEATPGASLLAVDQSSL